MVPMNEDGSNGYEAVATIYIAGRGTRSRVGDSIGATVVKAWSDAFPPGATVLDLGSGPGVPIEQNTVEASAFFNRTYSGVLAWGLLFLLDPAAQALVIEKVARALEPQGRFLFTAPRQPLEWLDAMTGRRSQSLGEHTYERLLRDAGLTWVADAQDEGENHYFFV